MRPVRHVTLLFSSVTPRPSAAIATGPSSGSADGPAALSARRNARERSPQYRRHKASPRNIASVSDQGCGGDARNVTDTPHHP